MYKVVIIRDGETSMPYTISNIDAASENEAINVAKSFVVQNGYWAGVPVNKRMQKLSVLSVKYESNLDRNSLNNDEEIEV